MAKFLAMRLHLFLPVINSHINASIHDYISSYAHASISSCITGHVDTSIGDHIIVFTHASIKDHTTGYLDTSVHDCNTGYLNLYIY